MSRPKASALVKKFVSAAQSASSKKAYAISVRHFLESGFKIPATPSHLAEYLAQQADRYAAATLALRIVAINRAHLEQGYPSPADSHLVKKTMQGIRRTIGTVQLQAKALMKESLIEVLLASERQKPIKRARDKCLLLLGFAGAFRRSELVSLQVKDITFLKNGAECNISRSKTDQEGKGRVVFIPLARMEKWCPVGALKEWLALGEIIEGPIFRAVNRHDQVSQQGLTPQSVSLVLKAGVVRLSGKRAAEQMSAHSLRAGFVTSAEMMNMPVGEIMSVTGHKSLEMVALYTRPVKRRQASSIL